MNATVHRDNEMYAQHCQMFEEYFRRVVEEEIYQCAPYRNHAPAPKNQARRTSAPVHRLPCQHNKTYYENKGQRRSQSLRCQGNDKFRTKVKSPSVPERNCSWRDGKERRWKTYTDERSEIKTNEHHHGDASSGDDPVEKKLQLVKMMQGLDCTVVRTFTTSSRGIINRGDSFKRKQSNDAPSTAHARGDPASKIQDLFDCPSMENSPSSTHNFSNFRSSSPDNKDTKTDKSTNLCTGVRNVVVMGDHGVGKTSLLQQFITSEFMGTADPVFDNELEKTVSVQVDDMETTLTFVDLPTETEKNYTQNNDIEAFIVCYSVTDRNSFEFATELLEDLKSRDRSDAAVIFVANKIDLVRTRKVSFGEGKSACQKYNCKFIEVSAAFNHCVDDLLVGLVHQIRLNPKRQRAKSVPNTGSVSSTDALLPSKSSSFSFGCFRGARVFLTEFFFGSKKTKSRSCDNLWTL